MKITFCDKVVLSIVNTLLLMKSEYVVALWLNYEIDFVVRM